MLSRRIAAAIVIFISMGPQLVAAADHAALFDLSSTDMAIVNPDDRSVIGHAHYEVTHRDGATIFEGENRFLDGEYDREWQRVEPSTDGAPPLLASYRHEFFAADGNPQSLDTLDAHSGTIACTLYDGARPQVRQANVTIPADTYAGSTQLMLLVGRLREGARAITMHSFICLPGPHLIAINVASESGTVAWPMYPGALVKLEMIPDFGWLGALAGPFLPKSYGWFDPGDAYNYVGGRFDRFYRRRNLMMVRERKEKSAASRSSGVDSNIASDSGRR